MFHGDKVGLGSRWGWGEDVGQGKYVPQGEKCVPKEMGLGKICFLGKRWA